MKILQAFVGELRKYLFEIKMYYPDQIVSTVVTIFIFIGMGLMSGNTSESSFYIGFVYWFLLSSLIGEASVSTSSEKQMGVLEQLMIQPIGLKKLILIRSSIWGVVNLVKVLVALIILKVILNLTLGFHMLLVPIFFIASLGILGFTMLLCDLTLKFTKTASFESIISYGIMILSGAIFPLGLLPNWLQKIGQLLPITKGIKISQTLIQGEAISSGEYLLFIIISVSYLTLGILAFDSIYDKSKSAGVDRRY